MGALQGSASVPQSQWSHRFAGEKIPPKISQMQQKKSIQVAADQEVITSKQKKNSLLRRLGL